MKLILLITLKHEGNIYFKRNNFLSLLIKVFLLAKQLFLICSRM